MMLSVDYLKKVIILGDSTNEGLLREGNNYFNWQWKFFLLLFSGLSEMYHPLQILADFLTLQVYFNMNLQLKDY